MHASNLTEFSIVMDETVKSSELLPKSHLRKFLEFETDHIRTIVSVLEAQQSMTRSLDPIGTALKVVAGTADDSNFAMLKMSESNNRQVFINTETQKHINKLTDTINNNVLVRTNIRFVLRAGSPQNWLPRPTCGGYSTMWEQAIP